MIKNAILSATFLFSTLVVFSQSFNELQNKTVEKIYIHTDKDSYSNTDTIYFQMYVVKGGSNIPSNYSQLGYVELVDVQGKVLWRENVRLNTGVGHGELPVPNTLPSGPIFLRSYTKVTYESQNNGTFEKRLTIISNIPTTSQPTPSRTEKKGEVDIQFLPEGGHMIDGKMTKVAFKGVGKNGRGVLFSGTIKDSNGEIMGEFSSNEWGMGYFFIIPEHSESYFAEVNMVNQKVQVPLPKAESSGYSLSVIEVGEFFHVLGEYTGEMPKEFKTYIVSGGIAQGEAASKEGKLFTKLAKNQLPYGITSLVIVDDTEQIRARRMIFNDYREAENHAFLQQNKSTYDTRSRVTLSFQWDNERLRSDSAVFSLAIVRKVFIDSTGATIQSHLSLASELSGFIEDPNRYFDQRNRDRNLELDVLMLTQGWTQYSPTDSDLIASNKIVPEKGLSFHGRAVNFYDNERGVPSVVTYTFLENPLFTGEFNTDPNGYFSLKDMDFSDSLNLMLQTRRIRKNDRRKERKDAIKVIQVKDKYIFDPSSLQTLYTPEETSEEIREITEKVQNIDSAYFNFNNTLFLEETVVTANKIKEDPLTKGRNMLYNNPSNRIILDSLNTYIGDIGIILQQVPGVRVSGSFPNISVSIRGISSINASNAPLIVLDGMPMDISFLNQVNTQQLAFIDILKGPSAAIYGSRGTNGVIALYTKQGYWTDTKVNWGINNFKLHGFQQPSAFYVPNYSTKKEAHSKPDFRTTLFWQPMIHLSAEKSESITFYTSDEESEYEVILQGVGNNGEVFYESRELVVGGN